MATDAFAQGKLAFEHNHPMSSCEFPVGSTLRAEWMNGWTTAQNSHPDSARQASGDKHPGMMGDGTEEQNLGQEGNPGARITEGEVKEAFASKKR